MTFFRHFPTKHAVVENDDYDPLIAELIRARPADEDPLTAIRRALTGALRRMPAAEMSTVLVRARLILGVPDLRAEDVRFGLGIWRYRLPCGLAWGHGGLASYQVDVEVARDGSKALVWALNNPAPSDWSFGDRLYCA